MITRYNLIKHMPRKTQNMTRAKYMTKIPLAMHLIAIAIWISFSTTALSGQHKPDTPRFTHDRQGVVTDNHTGLQWYYFCPDKGGLDWFEAESWVRNLMVSGGGWRMPTRSELAGLGTKKSEGCHLDPDFIGEQLFFSCAAVWSGFIRDSSTVWFFDFVTGKEGYNHPHASTGIESYAVRSRR